MAKRGINEYGLIRPRSAQQWPARVQLPALDGYSFGFLRVGTLTGLILLAPIIVAAIAPGLLSPYDPMANTAAALLPPSPVNPFGTDDLGRDLLSQIVSGARSALIVGVVAASLSVVIGIAIGLVSGYAGGLFDEALMRVTEFIKILPRFLIALLVATLYGPSLAGLCLVIGLMSWPGLARIVRAETIAQRSREYVIAARALGNSGFAVMTRHILSAAARPALAVLAPVATSAILAEAGLGYLGLSDPETISWGDLIRNGQEFYAHGWWLSVFPGIAIIITCLGFALVFESVANRDRR